jgi:hypothetical protein
MDVGGWMGGVKEKVFIKDNETMGGWHLGLAVSGGEEEEGKRLSRRCCRTL